MARHLQLAPIAVINYVAYSEWVNSTKMDKKIHDLRWILESKRCKKGISLKTHQNKERLHLKQYQAWRFKFTTAIAETSMTCKEHKQTKDRIGFKPTQMLATLIRKEKTRMKGKIIIRNLHQDVMVHPSTHVYKPLLKLGALQFFCLQIRWFRWLFAYLQHNLSDCLTACVSCPIRVSLMQSSHDCQK